ncbi:copper resistance CopC family protein [Nonomuraea gerenzanensis]|uniref:Copper resistance protein CopC n=1 Tax=Nonomuraea gerenzanensis TaxID=93944 RepID=A0A1M4E932_9ACTN|nr:copper resistance protein CopC [Nonomuraea gerenzanensis]UBU17568.1 copper resistance protein CopC [Nonomuraea gerenzanensis]SBO95330.1 Copper resistance protein CopC [Nonomuraea gerenzanensis]
MAFLFRRAVALGCALLLLTLPASPAYAHDTLKRSSPAKDAEVTSVEEVELEYSASVKFPFVVLHDAAGREVALGKPQLDGPLVSAEVPQPLAPGSYVLAWRVVSSDGHPIEGEIPFRVKGSSTAPASPTGSAAAAPSGTEAAQPSAAAGERPAASAGVPGWIWGGLVVLVVLGAFVLIRSSRRRSDREDVHAD